MSWQDRAACRGMDASLFFGSDEETPPGRGIRERRAREICASCPVRRDCLNYAIGNSIRDGIWGGLNEAERWKVRRRRARKTRAA
jgi:WhiB family transcriptional regulator, redox-sensing transcriptional regulator